MKEIKDLVGYSALCRKKLMLIKVKQPDACPKTLLVLSSNLNDLDSNLAQLQKKEEEKHTTASKEELSDKLSALKGLYLELEGLLVEMISEKTKAF